MNKLIPALLSLLLIAGMLFIFLKDTPGPKKIDFDRDMQFDLNIEGLTLEQGGGEKKFWELEASRAAFLRVENEYLLFEPVMIYYRQDESPPLRIQASQGRINQNDQVMQMWPDVRAESDGLTTRSDRATYLEDSGCILLEGNVVFTGRGVVIKASSGLIDLEEDTIAATGGVQTNIIDAEDEP